MAAGLLKQEDGCRVAQAGGWLQEGFKNDMVLSMLERFEFNLCACVALSRPT